MRNFLFFVFLWMISCSPKFVIQTDTPFPGDFKNYNSFKFYNPKNMPASNFSFTEEDQEVIFDAVAEEMKTRGYRSVQEADLMVKIQGGTKSSVEIKNDNYYPYDYNAYRYSRYGRYNDYYNRPADQSKKESTIIIDLIDTKTDKIVWQGVGIGSLNKKESLTPIKIREAISNIFLKYPYTAGSAN